MKPFDSFILRGIKSATYLKESFAFIQIVSACVEEAEEAVVVVVTTIEANPEIQMKEEANVEVEFSTTEGTSMASAMTGDMDLVVSIIEEVEEGKDPVPSIVDNKGLVMQMMDNKRQSVNRLITEFRIRNFLDKAHQTIRHHTHLIKSTWPRESEFGETVNIGRQQGGPCVGESADIAGLQSAQEWEKETILMWRKLTDDQKW
ncbi:hypothetical protein MMC15_002182 [Xylographa vitiligo]|nr:hypothetical protein [Xylographa vitiligo]